MQARLQGKKSEAICIYTLIKLGESGPAPLQGIIRRPLNPVQTLPKLNHNINCSPLKMKFSLEMKPCIKPVPAPTCIIYKTTRCKVATTTPSQAAIGTDGLYQQLLERAVLGLARRWESSKWHC